MPWRPPIIAGMGNLGPTEIILIAIVFGGILAFLALFVLLIVRLARRD